ncbi:DUF4350 domain-containing protein [Haloplanus halobius]|uniref:DUF4350 domain-containing protein n=1 Tax=Haloplanus halobius TaxID=2934938 RepID=UPI0020108AE0|nr:DUF4350 domain-containing protein [Haloplanus sp. XH21]
MRRKLAARIAVLCLTVVVVVAGAGVAPTLLGDDDEPDRNTDIPEYDPASVAPDPIAATGAIEPSPAPGTDATGTILIDRGHNNRFERTDIEPLVDALVRQGYHVEFYTQGDLATHLEDVDAFLVIDPGTEYLPGDINDVREFTANGGRLVMVGEPDRTAVRATLGGTAVQTQQSQLTTIASRYGMSVDTQYLYNQEHADGTFKHVLARPTGQGDLDGVERTAMYTAAAVTARDGTVLLRGAPNTHKSGSDDVSGEYPVAVRKNNALLLGDTTFLRGDRFNVADNEAFIAYLVEFMIEGDHRPPEPTTGPPESERDDSGSTATPTATPTPTPTPTPSE